MKVLLLGGTGSIGNYLQEILVENNIDTYVTSRKKRKSVGLLNYIMGDAHNYELLNSLLNDHWDVIVDFMVYSTSDFFDRYEYLLRSTDQYVFISTSRVYASSTEKLTEKSDRLLDVSIDKNYLLTDEYALSKARQEDLLINSNSRNWTIIRPYITYSDNRLQLGSLEKEEWLFRALEGKTTVFPNEMLNKKTTLTCGKDVSMGIYEVIGNRDALGEIFHITSNNSYSWQEVLEVYKKTFLRVTNQEMKVKMVNLTQFTEIHPAEYQIKYDRMYDRTFDNSKISCLVDISKFTDIDKGLSKCLERFLIGRKKFLPISLKLETKKDRLLMERNTIYSFNWLKNRFTYLFNKYLSL